MRKDKEWTAMSIKRVIERLPVLNSPAKMTGLDEAEGLRVQVKLNGISTVDKPF